MESRESLVRRSSLCLRGGIAMAVAGDDMATNNGVDSSDKEMLGESVGKKGNGKMSWKERRVVEQEHDE